VWVWRIAPSLLDLDLLFFSHGEICPKGGQGELKWGIKYSSNDTNEISVMRYVSESG